MEGLFKKIEKEAKKYLESSKNSHNFEHTRRVLNLCLKIGKKEDVNMKILVPAALLHDIGRDIEDKSAGKICHAQKGAEMAEKILKRHSFPKKEIAEIKHCIVSHRFRGKNVPKSLEAKILFDADKLDSIGAVGIGRAFQFASEVGAQLQNSPGIKIKSTKPYTKEDTAYREFLVKLNKIKARMLTKEGKKLAKERHNFMVEFFARFNKEIEGKL